MATKSLTAKPVGFLKSVKDTRSSPVLHYEIAMF
jgi:hypothetical protein